MFRVVAVSDKIGTAIDRLCQGVAKYHDNIEYIVCDVHPKRPDPQQLERFEKAIVTADVIDYQYFRTADMLRERYPQLKEIPSILTHNNPYSIKERDWNDYQIVVANNKVMEVELSRITSARLEYIPLCVDSDFWIMPEKYEPKEQVIMVANRIESKKGILEVAIACAELGLKFVLVGAISDGNYFNDIMATGEVEYHEQITDEQLRKLYWESKLHICNSQDNFESGTLPVLEAMLCGVPVLTRKVGHIPDLYNNDNMIINENAHDDVVAMMATIKDALTKDLDDIRNKAWNTAKRFNHERRAYGYQKLYRDITSTGRSVSVIVPICDKPEVTKQNLEAIEAQTYQNIEIIICDNSQTSMNDNVIAEFRAKTKKLVRYINVQGLDYGLARARNLGIIEATGELLVFCDQRMIMDSKAVEIFVNSITPRSWIYGNKGIRKEFVENFSCIERTDLIKLGMFCERMDRYGGLSQETRSRAKYNGYKIEFIEKAIATPVGKSGNKYSKRKDILKIKNKLWKMGMEL